MTPNQIPHIIIDNREQSLKNLLDKKKETITYEAQQLDIADIVISENTAIERKTGFDFVSSLTDNRLFEQLLRLKETYTCPILILEGLNDEVFDNVGVQISSIYGALVYISYKLGVSVIPTRNLEDTTIVIERIAYREQIKDGIPLLSRKAPKGMNVEERRSFILEGLIDIGPKKARILIEEFKTPHKVIKAIKHTEITYTRTGNPKGIRGPLEKVQGIGWKFVKKNKKLIYGKYLKGRQKKIDET
ncbi:MAG: ERCC4 domain-containing protein [Candidatus Thorarchaeota archaeon]